MEDLAVAQPTLDDQLVVLSHVKRRRLLLALLDENPVEIEPVDGLDPAENAGRRDYLIEMHHRHLPKLEAHGFIHWDRKAGVVFKGQQFEDIRPLIELIDDHRAKLPPDTV